MEQAFWPAFSTSVFAAAVTTAGVLTIRRFSDWGHRNTTYFMSFAAGVLISASFLHLIPKAISMTSQAPIWLLVGFLVLHLFNRFVTVFVCHRDPDKKEYGIGIIPMVGIGFHSFIDGFIYSITFAVSILTGFVATTGMVLHEFPEGIITYLLLRKGGISERRALLLALLAAAATTPVGTLISYPLVGTIKEPTLGVLLALSAGALVYVGATHLLPSAEQEHKKYSLIFLAGGVLVAVIIVLTKA